MAGTKLQYVKRTAVYCLGLFILALGIAFTVRSNLGVSPVSSVPFVVARITGLSLGMTTVLVYILNMAVQAVVLGRNYKPINLVQLAVSFLFGYFTDATLWLTSLLPLTNSYAVRIIYLAFGISLIALGVMFYLTTSLLALPTDGTVQAIALKGRHRLFKVKIGYDCISTALAVILSLLFLRDLNGIGIGTVAAAFGVGKMLGVFTGLFKQRLLRFLGINSVVCAVPGGKAVVQKDGKRAG